MSQVRKGQRCSSVIGHNVPVPSKVAKHTLNAFTRGRGFQVGNYLYLLRIRFFPISETTYPSKTPQAPATYISNKLRAIPLALHFTIQALNV